MAMEIISFIVQDTASDWTFMKISEVVKFDDYGCKENNYNVICLDDGDLCWFDWDEVVVKVEAKVVIEK